MDSSLALSPTRTSRGSCSPWSLFVVYQQFAPRAVDPRSRRAGTPRRLARQVARARLRRGQAASARSSATRSRPTTSPRASCSRTPSRLAEAADAYVEGQEFCAAAATLEQHGQARAARPSCTCRPATTRRRRRSSSTRASRPRRPRSSWRRATPSRRRGCSALAGQWDKAADLYAKSGYPLRAAEAYEKKGEFVQGGGVPTRSTSWRTSPTAPRYSSTAPVRRPEERAPGGPALREGGRPRAAALQIYTPRQLLQGGGRRRACSWASTRRRPSCSCAPRTPRSAADAYEQGGRPVKAANLRGEVALKEEKIAGGGAAFFQKGQDYLRAAELFESDGHAGRGGGRLRGGRELGRRGRRLHPRRASRTARPRRYERAGEFETAAKLYEEAGNGAQGHRALREGGPHLQERRGGGARRATATRRSRCCSAWPPTTRTTAPPPSSWPASSSSRAAPALAVERLQKAIAGQPVSAANLDLYYWLAVAQETVGNRAEAARHLQEDPGRGPAVPRTSTSGRRAGGAADRPPAPSAAARPSRARQAVDRRAAPPAGAGPVAPPRAAPAPAPRRAAAPAAAPRPSAARASSRTRRSAAARSGTVYPRRGPARRPQRGPARAARRRSCRRRRARRARRRPEGRGRALAPERRQGARLRGARGPALRGHRVRGRASTSREALKAGAQDDRAAGARPGPRRSPSPSSFVHGKGLVHGSIQPSNIMVASGVVKVADLGLGRLAHAAALRPSTTARRRTSSTSRATSTRWPPCSTTSSPACIPRRRRRASALPLPSTLATGVPEALDKLLLRCLHPRAELRLATADEILAELKDMVRLGVSPSVSASLPALRPAQGRAGLSRPRARSICSAVLRVQAARRDRLPVGLRVARRRARRGLGRPGDGATARRAPPGAPPPAPLARAGRPLLPRPRRARRAARPPPRPRRRPARRGRGRAAQDGGDAAARHPLRAPGGGPAAQSLVGELRGIFETRDSSGKEVTPPDRDLLPVLETLEVALADTIREGEGATAFLETVARVVGSRPAGHASPEPRLILEP